MRPGADLGALDRGCGEAVLASCPCPPDVPQPLALSIPAMPPGLPRTHSAAPPSCSKVPHPHGPLGLLVGLLEGSRPLGTRPLLRLSPTHAPPSPIFRGLTNPWGHPTPTSEDPGHPTHLRDVRRGGALVGWGFWVRADVGRHKGEPWALSCQPPWSLGPRPAWDKAREGLCARVGGGVA